MELGSKEYRDIQFRLINIGTSIKTIKEQRLIEFLSRNNLIPKYGFPVDTVELTSLGKGGDLNDLRLDRDLFSAISEYAPDSEVVADGKLITSRYVRVLNGYSSVLLSDAITDMEFRYHEYGEIPFDVCVTVKVELIA